MGFRFLYLGVFLSIAGVLGAQESSNTLLFKEKQLNSFYGNAKLQVLNDLASYYDSINSRKGLRYARQAVGIGKKIFNDGASTDTEEVITLLATAYTRLGQIAFKRERYVEAQKNVDDIHNLYFYSKDSSLLKRIEPLELQLDSIAQLGKLHKSFLSRTIDNLNLGPKLRNSAENIKIRHHLKLAETREKNKKFLPAIEHYEEAINLYRNQGAASEITDLQLRIASLYDSLGMHTASEAYLEKVIADRGVKTSNTKGLKEDVENPMFNDSLINLQSRKKEYKRLFEEYAGQNDYQRSLDYYKRYQEIEQRLFEDSIQTVATASARQSEIKMLKQQKDIASLNLANAQNENKRQALEKRGYLFAGILAFALALVGYFLFLNKRKQHSKLTTAYQNLDISNEKLKDAEKRITTLLKQQVSSSVADQLINENGSVNGSSRFVCILFLDIRGFTKIAQMLSAQELISFQNEAFGPMIDIVQQNKGIVNQLMGDGFMATFGVTTPKSNNCKNAYEAASQIIENLDDRIKNKGMRPFEIGIGLHAGNVVTGNVGNKKRKQFSITGNPVIIASRLEQLNKTYGSQMIMSNAVYDEIDFPNGSSKVSFDQIVVRGRDDLMDICIFSAT